VPSPASSWPDEPILDDAETRREVQTTNPMVEFRRWVAMEGEEVAGSIRAAFRRPGTLPRKIMLGFCGRVAVSGQAPGVAASALCCSAKCIN
jgi:hypothetical protein